MAAWYLQGRQMPPEIPERYDLIYTLAAPPHVREGTTLLAPLCVQDAPGSPSGQGASDAAWSRFVNTHNLWYLDDYAQRVAGWGGAGANRWAVDNSIEAPWTRGISEALRAALGAGCHGLHLDDCAVYPYFENRVNPKRGCAEWRAHSQQMAYCLPSATASINGGKHYYVPPGMQSQFSYIKFEDCHVSETGRATLGDWIEGREGWSDGIIAMDRAGHEVVWERFVPNSWTKDRVDAYGEMMLAVILLTNLGRVMIHGSSGAGGNVAYPGTWWRTPIWCPAFDRVEQIGTPLKPAQRMRNGGWRRQYLHGVVGVNPTSRDVACPGVGTLAPNTGRVLVA